MNATLEPTIILRPRAASAAALPPSHSATDPADAWEALTGLPSLVRPVRSGVAVELSAVRLEGGAIVVRDGRGWEARFASERAMWRAHHAAERKAGLRILIDLR